MQIIKNLATNPYQCNSQSWYRVIPEEDTRIYFTKGCPYTKGPMVNFSDKSFTRYNGFSSETDFLVISEATAEELEMLSTFCEDLLDSTGEVEVGSVTLKSRISEDSYIMKGPFEFKHQGLHDKFLNDLEQTFSDCFDDKFLAKSEGVVNK